MPKTKEELEQLKKDYQKLTEQASQLSEEELENVTGGGCQTYSEGTYNSLGISPSDSHGQVGTNHPLITTLLNSCKLISSGKFCDGCAWIHKPANTLTVYCRARSKEYDPGK